MAHKIALEYCIQYKYIQLSVQKVKKNLICGWIHQVGEEIQQWEGEGVALEEVDALELVDRKVGRGGR